MKHIFIIDPKSFSGQQWKMETLLDDIGQYFRTQEQPNFSTLVIKYAREAIGLIQKQIDETDAGDTIRVYAVGGDNILFDCLNGIADLPYTELAVISYGEGKTKLLADVKTMVEAPVIPSDVIQVGNNYAINGCTVGFSPAVDIKLKAIIASFGTRFNRFSAALWRFMINLTSILNKSIVASRYSVSIDDEDYSGNYSLIKVVNRPCFERKKSALSGAIPDDGLLDVILFKSAGLLPTLWSFGRYSAGKIPSNCIHVQAKKIAIQSDNPMWIQTDSEYLMDTAITFNVLPEAVQIVDLNNMTYQRF